MCEVWPSLEASPGRIQSVAGRLGQLTATRGNNQIIHENEFPFWYWVNYYYYLGSTTRATMLSNNNNNNNTMLLCCLDFCFVKSWKQTDIEQVRGVPLLPYNNTMLLCYYVTMLLCSLVTCLIQQLRYLISINVI